MELEKSLQTHRMYFAIKLRGNGRLHDVSMWNASGVFVGMIVKFTAFTCVTLVTRIT